ncbi:erythromycin esterase family protein [Aggregatilinea lenta]|uniref:erythromycin esterase family protein n=1 Tax=Aggregatilinea lenta TaxID=913108 RepID=UPI000E5BBF69|nr:erythromycin esterase family protein [Aggregatilinea lenta]
MSYKALAVVVIVCLVGIAGAIVNDRKPEPRRTDPDITAWLQANAIAFDTAEPGGSDADLLPLKDAIGDARIVALGEPTPGVHEFFAVRQRLVELLVEDMGFTVLGLEIGFVPAEHLNAYLQTGDGDPADLVAAVAEWSWYTQEVLDLIAWLRAYNVAHPDQPVQIFGFNTLDVVEPRDAVLAYLREVDPGAAARAETHYSCLSNLPEGSSTSLIFELLPQAVNLSGCGDALQAVYDDMARFRARYEPTLGTDAYESALHSARVLVQAQDYLDTRVTMTTDRLRDRYMAENVEWLMAQQPDAKIILWAQNNRIARSRNGYGTTLAGRLEADHGDELYTIGFTFYQGAINTRTFDFDFTEIVWSPVGPVELPPAPLESHEATLHSAGLPRFILNFKGLDLTGDARWLRRLSAWRMIGEAYFPDYADNYTTTLILPTAFDAVIFFDEVTPSHLRHLLWVEYVD